MPDREKLQFMYDNAQKFDGDKELLQTVMENGGNILLTTLKKTSLDVLDLLDKDNNNKSFEIRYTNPINTVPTTSIERLEESVKAKRPNAMNTVMRAEHGLGGEHHSRIFNNLNLDLHDAHEIQLKKKLNNNKTATFYVDPLFDKSIGLSCEKKYSDSAKIKYFGEFDINQNEGNLGFRYKDSSCNLKSTLYLGENMGVNFKGYKKIDSHSKVKGNASLFKNGAAIKVEYEKIIPNKTYISVGAYGSSEKKEFGVMGRLAL